MRLEGRCRRRGAILAYAQRVVFSAAMNSMTLDRVLTSAEALPADEREMLEQLLHKRRVEAWREQTARMGRKALKDYRAGRIKPEPVEDIIARLNAAA